MTPFAANILMANWILSICICFWVKGNCAVNFNFVDLFLCLQNPSFFFVKNKEVYSVVRVINEFMFFERSKWIYVVFQLPFCYGKNTIFTNLDFNSAEAVTLCDLAMKRKHEYNTHTHTQRERERERERESRTWFR